MVCHQAANSSISSSDMRRFIGYFTIVFAAVVILAIINDQLCVWLIRHSGSSSAAKMERLWKNPEPDEIPIFGSSRALGNYVPTIISPKCFNYGCNGMGKEEVTFLMNVAAKRNGTQPVIINFDPWQEPPKNTNVQSLFVGDYRLAPQSGRLSLVERIPGIRFHGSLKANLVGCLNSRKAVTKVIDRGAEILKNSRSAEEWKVMNEKRKPWSYHENPELDMPFEQAITSFAPRKVYVVLAPCASRDRSMFKDSDKLVNYLRHLRSLSNVIVIDEFTPYLNNWDNTFVTSSAALWFNIWDIN